MAEVENKDFPTADTRRLTQMGKRREGHEFHEVGTNWVNWG